MARTLIRSIAVLSLVLVAGLARAQEADSYDADPPERAARLSLIRGDVSLQPLGEEEWAAAVLNRPLTTGDKLWTERGARAEIQVSQSVVRLDGDTGFSFLNLDDDTVQMRITAGTMILDVRELTGREQIEIDTPNIALSILRPGSYRVEVNDAGDVTTVKIGEGEAEAFGTVETTLVHSNQKITFRGMDQVLADWGTLGPPDEFDNWSMERERRLQRVASSASSRYVSPDVTGYEDLDEYGSWSSEPEYGYVWTPSRVAAGWSPYRFGRWVWVSPWGWTWIDDSPWGYAPFHYGRWAHIRHRWCWVPGPRHVRAVYAPALVAWVGTPGLSVSWFPLGPREIYVPYRRYSHRYFERVNLSNTVASRIFVREMYENRGRDVRYRNRAVPGSVIVASRGAFTSGGRVRDHGARVDERDLARSHVTPTPPRIEPVRESRLGAPLRGNVRRPPPAVADRQVVVRRDPPQRSARWARPPSREGRDVAPTTTPDRSPRLPLRGQASNDRERPSMDERRERTAPAEQPREDRSPRLPLRGQASNDRERPNVDERRERTDPAEQPREDRPPREVRAPAFQPEQRPQSSVFDRRALSDRVRDDRERQAQERQQREVFQQERDQQERREQMMRHGRDESQRAQQRQEDERQSAARRLMEQRTRDEQHGRAAVRERVERERPVQRDERPPPQQERPQQAPRQERQSQPERSNPPPLRGRRDEDGPRTKRE